MNTGVQPWHGVLHAYSSYLPVTDRTPVVSLHEGNTPLIPMDTLAEEWNLPCSVYVKYEGLNPTGSFKDRGMVLAVSKAKEEGSEAVICASTGNTSASAAAYAARAGLRCIVVLPEGKVASGKLAQAIQHGAEVVQVKGNFDHALGLVQKLADQFPVTVVNSLNPYRLQGQMTGAFEVCEQLGRPPSHLCIPVGNAGNITAYWRGFKAFGYSPQPRMWGFQAEGAAPLVSGQVVVDPETVATAIRIGNPVSWKGAIGAAKESGGGIWSVSDQQILSAWKQVADLEGLFVEPASAASLAGLKLMRDKLTQTDLVVCVCTGHGLKDPERAVAENKPLEEVLDSWEDVVQRLGFTKSLF